MFQGRFDAGRMGSDKQEKLALFILVLSLSFNFQNPKAKNKTNQEHTNLLLQLSRFWLVILKSNRNIPFEFALKFAWLI